MNKIVILVKTYLGDIKYVERLIRSYNKHNRDNIPLFIVAPKSDLKRFKGFKSISSRSSGLQTSDFEKPKDFSHFQNTGAGSGKLPPDVEGLGLYRIPGTSHSRFGYRRRS